MADKDIKIGITTAADTTGAAAAEESIKKVTAATEDVGEQFDILRGKAEADAKAEAEQLRIREMMAKASDEHSAAMQKAYAATQDLREGMDELKGAADELAGSTEEATQETTELEKNVSQVARAQKAKSVADLADKVGLIGAKFKEAASEVRAFDARAADALDATGDRIQQVTGAVSQLALGFAVGGPLGAGVAAIGIGIGALVNAFMAAEVAAIKSGAVQTQALKETEQAARDAETAARARAEELVREDIAAGIERQNDALARGVQFIRDQLAATRQRRREEEEILKAQDKLELARIDEAEATGGIGQVEAERRRAEVQVGAARRADEERKKQSAEAATAARKIADLELADFTATEEQRAATRERVRQKEAEIEKAERIARVTDERDADLETARRAAASVDPIANAISFGGLQEDADAALRIAEEAASKVLPGVNSEEAKAAVESAKKELADLLLDLEKSQEDVIKKQKTAGSALNEADRAEAAAGDTIKTVDTRAAIVAEERDTRQRAVEARRAADAKRKADADAAREAERLRREEERAVAAETRGVAGRAGGIIAGANPGAKVTQDVRAATERLRDGATADEIGDLGAAAAAFADAAVSIKQENRDVIRKFAADMANLSERMRRLEGK